MEQEAYGDTSMAKTPHSFDFYTANFIEAVRLFEPDEVGAYTLLLCHQWKHGFIPEDDRGRMKAAQIMDSDQWSRVWGVIRGKFDMVNYRDVVGSDAGEPDRHVYANPRMHRDRNKQVPKYLAAVERAITNGKQHKRNASEKPKSVPKSDPTSVPKSTPTSIRGKGEEGSKKREDIVYPEKLNFVQFRNAIQLWSEARTVRYGALDALSLQVPFQRCLSWYETYGSDSVVDAVLAAAEGSWKSLQPPSRARPTSKAPASKPRKRLPT